MPTGSDDPSVMGAAGIAAPPPLRDDAGAAPSGDDGRAATGSPSAADSGLQHEPDAGRAAPAEPSDPAAQHPEQTPDAGQSMGAASDDGTQTPPEDASPPDPPSPKDSCATSCPPDRPHCVHGSCVQCEHHADCQDLSRPQCKDHTCIPCTSDDACHGRPNAGVCDAAAAAERRGGKGHGKDDGNGGDRQSAGTGSGACVECTADDEHACGGYVCDPVAKRCTARQSQSADLCAPCISDSECKDHRACMDYVDLSGTALGSYCVTTDDDVCLTGCAIGLALLCSP